MLYIGKELPQMDIDENEYKPFIRHEWFRRNYMWFAYGLMLLLFITALSLGRLRAGHFIIRLILFVITIINESEEKIQFEKDVLLKEFYQIFGEKKNTIEISSINNEKEEEKYLIVSFLPVLFKCRESNFIKNISSI